MQDGWNPRAAGHQSAFPAAPALPSLRSVAAVSSSSAVTPSTTGAAASTAGHPRALAAASFPQHLQSPHQDAYQHFQPHPAGQQQYAPEHAQFPAYQELHSRPAAGGAYDRVYIKQEAPHAPPRNEYSSASHAFAQSLPPAAVPALPKLSHMLRASSMNDVLSTRQSWTQEPEPEPEYARRPTGMRAPTVIDDLLETKSSIGFILGGQGNAAYTSTSGHMTLPGRSAAASGQFFDPYPPRRPAPTSTSTRSPPLTYWRHDAHTAPRHALPPHSLAAAGRAASDPALPAMGVQRKVETARPASRTCKFEGCEQYVVDHGLCVRHGGGKRCLTEGCTSRAKHFGRCWRHGGSIECKIDGCINRAKSRGYCWSHGGGTKCKAHPCEKIAISNGLCWAHGGGKRCVVSGCRKQAYERTRNLCNSHFQLYKKGLLPPSATALVTLEPRVEAMAEGAAAATSATASSPSL